MHSHLECPLHHLTTCCYNETPRLPLADGQVVYRRSEQSADHNMKRFQTLWRMNTALFSISMCGASPYGTYKGERYITMLTWFAFWNLASRFLCCPRMSAFGPRCRSCCMLTTHVSLRMHLKGLCMLALVNNTLNVQDISPDPVT